MSNDRIKVVTTNKGDRFWEKTKAFAKHCSWVAGPALCTLMETYQFKDWEGVFISVLDEEVIGFSTFTEVDCIPKTQYGPFVGFVFVGEPYRGNQLGAKMVEAIFEHAKSVGFKKIYVASNEKGLYEKMKFNMVDYQKDNRGNLEQIFVREIK